MKKLKGELSRITTGDGLQLHGILYEPPEKSDKALIHIHGWTGNFYENILIEYIANACVNNGYAFLSFNTRGAGFIQEFIRKKGTSAEYVKIGGSLEKFEDCLIDIKAAIVFLQEKGYSKFILEGHSTGCQKALFYKYKTKDNSIMGLIFLEPADDPSIVKRILAERYEEAINHATKLIQDGTPNEAMPDWVKFGVKLAAQKFLSIADPDSVEGKLLYLPGELHELKSLTCPVLVISADHSEYQDANGMQKILRKIIKNNTMNIVADSSHWFFEREEIVGTIISKWIKRI